MEKTSEGMRLEEVRLEYSRKLDDLKELNRMRFSFLRLTVIVLSLVFVGIGFYHENNVHSAWYLPVLTIIMFLITIAVMIAFYKIYSISLEAVKLDSLHKIPKDKENEYV